MSAFNPITDSRRRVLLVMGVSRAWSDAGGTTLCNDGDHCLKLEDLSGNGYHAVQNGTQPGPIYRAAGLGGLPYLDFSGTDGKSLAVTPDAGLNAVQATHDYTLYGSGTYGTGNVPGNEVAVFCGQCDDADFAGTLSLDMRDTFGITGGYGPTVYANCFPNATGARPYYTTNGEHVRFGYTENATAKYRLLYGGFGCGGNGSAPGTVAPDNAPNTTGNIIIGAKYFTTWNDWRPWYGQWHSLCYYSTSLSAPEVYQLDAYLLALRSQTHVIYSAPYVVVWDGNSHGGINSTLVPDVVGLLGISPKALAHFGYHFKSTSDMIAYGSEIDDLVALMRQIIPSKRIVLVGHELTNDFGANSAATLYGHYLTYFSARLAGGVNACVAATMLDQESMSGADETRRGDLNTLVRAGTAWRTADWAGDPALEPWNGTDYTDSLHPNAAGNTAGAPYFANQIKVAARSPASAMLLGVGS